MIARLVLLVVLACAPLSAVSQSTPFRIAWLSTDSAASGSLFFDAFRQGLRELNHIEGRDVSIDARWAEGSDDRLNQLAMQLVHSKPQVIVAQGGPALRPLMQARPTMPVVFSFSGDVLATGFIDSLARPGHNATGVMFLSLDLVGKRIELLKEVMPGVKRVAIMANPEHPGDQAELQASQAAAKALGLTLQYFRASSPQELDVALAAISKSGNQAVVVFPDAISIRNRERIAAFSLAQRIPVVSGWAQYAESGSLMSYGPNLRESYRRLATYVDRIMKGANAGDIPVELPTTVELVINLKTAAALGITIPNSVLLRADTIIK